MKIIDALKSENHNSCLMISNGDKWMYYNNASNEWVVISKKYGKKKITQHIRTTDEQLAVDEMLKED